MTETSAPAAPAAVKVIVPVTFTLGSLESSRYMLQQSWVTAEPGEGAGRFDLTCGAGLGNSLLRATAWSADPGAVIAETSITNTATHLFNVLKQFAGDGTAPDPLGDVIRAARDLIKVIDSGNKTMLGIPAHKLRDALDALTEAGLGDF